MDMLRIGDTPKLPIYGNAATKSAVIIHSAHVVVCSNRLRHVTSNVHYHSTSTSIWVILKRIFTSPVQPCKSLNPNLRWN